MKKIVLLGFAFLTFVGCTMSPEKKSASIVEKIVKNSLYHPDSYDPISTVVDSAFSPMDDPDFFKKTLKLYEIGIEMDDCEREMKRAKSSMASWSDLRGAYYDQYKDEYEEYAANMETLQKKGEKLGKELEDIAEQGRNFIGWKVTHSYRAQNNAGQTLIGECVFILDPEMTQILAGYDTDDSDYINVQMMYEMMEDEYE